ncbi:MAG: hypothetical protein ACE5QW_06130 [Thermoplasmata archaeon]
MDNEIELVEETTLRDVGNGFIILGCVLLVIYVALLILAYFVYAEEGWKVWTYPSMFGLATAVIVFLLFVGLVLRYIPVPPPEMEELNMEEE